jgi:uncharacterized protein
MNRLISTASLMTLVLAIAATVNAQTSTKPTEDSRRATRVLVSGDSIVQAQPDTAVITIAVVTQAKQAIDAQQQNATKSDAVMRALKSAAGTGAEVKTSGYNLQPQRIYKEGQPPTITGYEARNSVTVTVADLTKIGLGIGVRIGFQNQYKASKLYLISRFGTGFVSVDDALVSTGLQEV